jgi:tRNA uracil 4-sulfurtransferase
MVVICRYGEIFLKGANRWKFEQALVRNVKTFLENHNIKGNIQFSNHRILINTEEDCQFLTRVFGLTSISSGLQTSVQIQDVSDAATKLLNGVTFESFRVTTRRLTKAHPLTSQEISTKVGALLVEKLGKRVDLHEPDVTVGVEIIDQSSYIFIDTYRAVGGLPVGVSGTVGVLTNSRESELAAIMMMKRGCNIVGVGLSELSLAQAFTPTNIKKIDFSDLSEEKSVSAIASPDTYCSDIASNSYFPVLTPLIGLSSENILKRLDYYESLC